MGIYNNQTYRPDWVKCVIEGLHRQGSIAADIELAGKKPVWPSA